MESIALVCTFIFISGSFQDAAGEKPKMIPVDEIRIVNEGDELRIECYSKEAKLQFSFPEDEVTRLRSNYEILQFGNGTYTFLRGSVVPDDAGWYACAEDGIEIDNHFSNINHTHKDISWIYVYVTDNFGNHEFTDFYSRIYPKTLILVAGSNVVVPCRSPTPTRKVQLWQNFEPVLTDGTAVQYDPKIGFILKAVNFEDGEAALWCTTEYDKDHYVLRTSGPRPTMITAGSELTVQEGTELRIECYSQTKLSFLFPEGFSNSSKYEIFANESGVKTFLRRSAVADDTGWYGCAGDEIENDIPYQSINYTRKEISWIYVYVNSTVPITSGLIVTMRILENTIIPCRPTSPGLHVQLVTWQNGSISKPARNVPFDPKLGFVLRRPYLEENVYACTTNEPVDYVSKTYDLFFARSSSSWSDDQPTIVDVDDLLASKALSIRMTGEDLRLLCETAAPEVEIFGLQWRIPSTVSKDRVHYHRTRADNRVENSVRLRGKKSMMTITNISETDSGEYICIRRNTDTLSTGWEFTAKNSRRVEVFDEHGGRFMKVGKQGGEMEVVGLKGGTVKWLLDLEDFPSANVSWSDIRGHLINDSSNPNRRRHVESTSRRGSPYLLFTISRLTLADGRIYRIYIYERNTTTLISIHVDVQEPAVASIGKVSRYTLPTEELIAVDCLSSGSPSPHVTWSFLHLPKFPSDRDSKLTYLVEMSSSANVEEGTEMHYLKFNINMSGVLTCKACNSVNCSQDEKQILYSASDEPYFTSTNLNHSSLTLSWERIKTSTIILECYAAGRPYPNVTWFKDKILLRENKQFNFAYDNRELRILHFYDGDSGRYTCKAENEHGKVENYVDITIREPPLASVWLSYNKPYTTGEDITATCRSYGIPQPDVKFSFLNLPKFPSRMNSKLSNLKKMSYTFYVINDAAEKKLVHSVTFRINVSGVVICEACNPVTCSLDEKEILYSVSEKPYFTSTNLNRSEVTVYREIDEHKTSILECYAAGRPYPNVTWFKDNKPLQGDCSQFKFANDNHELSILFFVNGDSGRYMCRAENEHGKVENYVDVKVKGAPNILRTSFIIASSVLLGVIVISWVAIGKLRIEATRKKLIDSAFKNGALDSLNPELPIVDQAELLPYDLKWEFPRELLTLDKILGSGAFGIVKKATAKSICRGEAVTTVAVKLVRSKASLNFITALTRELKILVYLGKHMNVVNLLGACTKNVSYGELFVIVEYCHFGNLHDYLIRGRADFIDETQANTTETSTSSVDTDGIDITDESPSANDRNSTGVRGQDTDSTSTSLVGGSCTSGEDSGNARGFRSNYRGDCEDMNLEPIRTRDLVYWSWQVSRGMDYLGKRKVVHGDLAARNILLAENGIVKISDFGLSKALYEEAQYRDQGVDPLPVKWMAPESIRDRVFSYQSDIWSFGIVMWEFFTLAKTPYPGIKCRELYQQLVNGYRMEKPEFATSTLYDTMLDCWESDPSKRPSFIELAHSFDDSLDEGFKSHYLDMISSYIEINADMFENGSKDYLTLSPSTFDALGSTKVSTQIEMDDLPHDEATNSE